MADSNCVTPTPLAAAGFLRQKHILGDKKAKPPIPAIIPVGHTAWWDGIRAGRYPKPYKLGPRVTVWLADDIRQLIEQTTGKAS